MRPSLGHAPCWAVLLAACAAGSPPPKTPATPPAAPTPVPAPASSPVPAASDRVAASPPAWDALWHRRITPLVAGTPWRSTGRYDAALLLMLPLHAAFETGYQPGEQEFGEHMRRFLLERDSVRLSSELQLSWLQYFYLVSRFLVLAADHGRTDLIPDGLPQALGGWVIRLWTREPAWQWRRRPFLGGVRERVLWKLADTTGSAGTLSYERAILDQELFLFAIGADLRHYSRLVGSPLATKPELRDMQQIALRVYRARVKWNADSGWTFQPGAWRDHPDFRFSCWTEKLPGLQPCQPITDVAEDASHTHRSPLWLRSLAEAAEPGSAEWAYYDRLLNGLERQFLARVLVAPTDSIPGWRMTNFMDGRNGIYRWGYESLGANQGYGPYELSGTLLLGWWSFLPGPRIRDLYQSIVGEFPLPPPLLVLYAGPAPHGRPPASASGVLVDGTAELLCRLRAELP